MIDICLYRLRIGCYNPSRSLGKGKGEGDHVSYDSWSAFSPNNFPHSMKYFHCDLTNFHTHENIIHCPQSFTLPFISFHIYVYIMFILILSSITLNQNSTMPLWAISQVLFSGLRGDLSLLCNIHIKVAYLYLIARPVSYTHLTLPTIE